MTVSNLIKGMGDAGGKAARISHPLSLKNTVIASEEE